MLLEIDFGKARVVPVEAIQELREDNKTVPIIVEGEKDREALRKLDVTGEIIRFNVGMSISNFCDMMARKYKSIILLTDWDRKGGYLCAMIKKNLESRVTCNTKYREMFAKRSTIRTIEGLTAWINTLKKKAE